MSGAFANLSVIDAVLRAFVTICLMWAALNVREDESMVVGKLYTLANKLFNRVIVLILEAFLNNNHS